MALSEPGKTRQRKPGPQSSSTHTSKRTASVSSIHSNNSSSSLQAPSKGTISKHHGFPGSNKATGNTKMYPPLASSHSQSSVGKGHERSKSDVAGIKLSAESSSVTSLTSLKKGHISNGKYLSIVMKYTCYS